jgi:hypothetical protein
MADFAGDATTELERKLGPLKVVCVLETASYLALLGVWQGLRSTIGTQIVGSVHGMIFTAFALMVLNLFRPMAWTWRFLVLAMVPIVGGIAVYERVRRRSSPAIPAA